MAISLSLHTHGHPTPNKLCRTASKCLNSSQLALNDKHFFPILHNRYLPTRSDFLKMPFVPFSVQSLSSRLSPSVARISTELGWTIRCCWTMSTFQGCTSHSGLYISYFIPLTLYLSVNHKHFEFGLLDTPLLLQYPLFRAGNLIFDQRDRGA